MKKRGRGRPPKISEELVDKLSRYLHVGCDIKSACSICEVGRKTYYAWKEKSEKGVEPYATLFSTLSRARDNYRARLLKIVLDAAMGVKGFDWKAAAWALERQFPKDYAPTVREQVQLSHDETVKQTIGTALIFPPGFNKSSFAFPRLEQKPTLQPVPVLPDGAEDYSYLKPKR